MNKHIPRDRKPNKHEFDGTDGDPNFSNKLARAAKDHMITRRGRNVGNAPGGGNAGNIGQITVRNAMAADFPRSQRARSKYMPHQGKRECARRQAQMCEGMFVRDFAGNLHEWRPA